MHLEAYAATRPQEGRSGNEDAFSIVRDAPGRALVAAVADGAGAAGQAAGRVLRLFERLVADGGEEALERFPSWAGWVRALDSSLLGGTQSTFVAVAALAAPERRGARLVGAWVGDSRAYVVDRDGEVDLLTGGSSRFRLGSGRVEPRAIHRVLAELFHLVSDHPCDLEAAWKLVRSGAFTILPITDADLPALQELMARYADRPMDFADATLVHVAARESLTTVFSVDHDDFETYRIPGGRTFRVVPSRS